MKDYFDSVMSKLFPVKLFVVNEQEMNSWEHLKVVNENDPYSTPVRSTIGVAILKNEKDRFEDFLRSYDLGQEQVEV